MKLELKCDKNGKAGVLERFRVYKYFEDGSVSIRCAVTIDEGKSLSLQEPSVLRQNEFIPLSQIEKEMGIAKYIRAKKPFYSLLDNKTFIMSAKIAFTLEDQLYLPEKSHFRLLYPKGTVGTPDGNAIAQFFEINSYTPEFLEWFRDFATKFAGYNFNRELFLKSRL